ncbi:glycoside hydrolase superfamily [Rhodocollybia butyracea]|uniref:chitinase n=1 Tax=Rhodocollybia butyracea TaxID=206335 RepID=A0A9P5Q0H6_9AGAR|nr:glycoside hydrolase superfamily [Rhodocollybia butyracea]
MVSILWTLATLLLSASVTFGAFNPNSNTNLVAYWGQNSFGAVNPNDPAGFQTNLATYCQQNTVDVFPLAFLDVFFGIGGLPEVNFANICNDVDDAVFPGTDLANCQFMASDIETCQAMGKIVTLSMGGATGAATFTSDAQAEQFATLIWNLFLGGSSSTRPFGNAVLDGIDLDIEGGGSTGLAAFVTQIRTLAKGASKPYYISAAPQCPFPDAFIGSTLNAVGFDMVFVQFYNNFCGLSNFGAGEFDFSTWDNWAKNTSPNRNVKVFIGAPAAPAAAGSGYVSPAQLTTIVQQTKASFSSFGGVMLVMDISQAVANSRYDASAKSALLGGSSAPTAPVSPSSPTSHSSSASTPTHTSSVTNGNCAGASAWVSNIAYVAGSSVIFNGDLWISNQWSDDETPGGANGAWVNQGACTTQATLIPAEGFPSASSVSITAHSSASSNTVATPHSAQPSASATSALIVPVTSAIAASSAASKASAIAASSATSVRSNPTLPTFPEATRSVSALGSVTSPQSSNTTTHTSNSTDAQSSLNATEVSNSTSTSPKSRFFKF